MLNKSLTSLLSCFIVLSGLGQSDIDYPVCSLDDAPVRPGVIAAQLISVSKNDVLWEYLQSVKKQLSIGSTQYVLKNITQRATSCALMLKNGNVIERTIAINEGYFAIKVSPQLKKAMFIWIIGHEITHHKNDDQFFLDEKDLLKNISKEVLCDENAGYLVGKLTTDINLNDISIILTSILRNNESSIYYPPLKYRIYAAQAGWLRAKAEQAVSGQAFNVLGSKITKLVGQENNGFREQIKAESMSDTFSVLRQDLNGINIYFGTGSGYRRNGTGIFLAKLNSAETFNNVIYGNWIGEYPKIAKEILSGYVYWGEYDKWIRSGNGEMYWYGVNDSKDKYFGHFADGKRNGFGVYFYEDGRRYMGEWLNSDKNGYGVLYKGDKVISAGCWKDNKFYGEDCEVRTNE